MTVAIYMDHNVVRAVVEGCRAAGLDVLTAFEDGWHERSDDDLTLICQTLALEDLANQLMWLPL